MYCGTPLAPLVASEVAAEASAELSDYEVPSAGRPATESVATTVGGVRTISTGEMERSRHELRQALLRSRGPFGPRHAPYRLFLIPSAANASGAYWLRHRLADTVGIDLYTACSNLNRLVPSYLAGDDDIGVLETMAAPLREGGLVVSIVARDTWLDDCLPVPVIAVSREPGSSLCTFLVADGTSVEVSCASITWASMAQIESAGLPGSAAREPQGLRSTTALPALARDRGSFQLLDLMRREGGGALRLRSDQFDFACLGAERTISAGVNMRAMLVWLSPDPDRPIVLDEYFRRVPAVGVDRPGDRPDAKAGGGGLARELEFTEYVLILDHSNRHPPAPV
jgi:hypothetical protein